MTRDDLDLYVRSRFGISSTETDRVTRIVQQINIEYARLVVSEQLAVTTAALASAAGVATISLPADIGEILTIRGTPASTGESVDVWIPVTRQELARLSSLGSAPEQFAYAFEPPSTIRLPWAPTTTDSTFATLEYVRQPALLSSGAAIPSDIPTQYHDLLAELVVHRIALDEEDQPLAQSAYAIAQSLLADMRQFIGRRGGRSRPYIVVRGLG